MQADRPTGDARGLRVRLLGALSIRRDGGALALPASRKVRALIAYLALAPHPVGRSRLCELLWNEPRDPRGELRWCLSKLRKLLNGPARRRVETHGDAIALELSDCFVDALEIGRAAQQGIDRLAPERLRALAQLFAGDFLEGVEIDRSPEFSGWLVAQRCRLRACHAAVLEHLVARMPAESDEVFAHLHAWLQLAPFDRRAHAMLLDALAARGRIHEGEQHVAAAGRLFEAEGLESAPLREAWRAARSRPANHPAPDGALALSDAAPAPAASDVAPAAQRRASIAVMPFADGSGAASSRLADGLAHDVSARLAKMRHLFVIAHGTTAALGERKLGAEEAARVLGVDYVAGGSLRRR